MTINVPTPVDVLSVRIVTGPPTTGPQSVPPGPGTTGRIPTAVDPLGPPEKSPPSVSTGTTANTTANTTTTPPVTETAVANAESTITNIPVAVPIYVKVLSDGTVVTQSARSLNFRGSGFSISGNSSEANITIIGGNGSPGGNTSQIQFNNGGLFAGSANLTFNSTTQELTVGGRIAASGTVIANSFVGDGSQLTGITNVTGNLSIVDTSISIVDGTESTVINISPDIEGWTYLQLPTDATANVADVRLHNDAGNIEIGTGDFSHSGPNYTWKFDNTGALNLAGAGVVRRQDSVNIVSNGFSQLQWVDSGNLNIADPNGTGGPTNWAYISQGGFTVETNINNGGNSYGWYFGLDGNLTVPGIIQNPTGNSQLRFSNGFRLESNAGNNSTYIDGQPNALFLLGGADGTVVGAGPSTWSFEANGNFTAPGNMLTTGNITGGNLLTIGVVSAAGNVRGANLNTVGIVSATGNITGNYFIGNGSQLTGLPATYGNANVVANLAALGSNPISTTGNITGGYIFGNGSQLTGLPANYGNANVVTLLAGYGSNTISTTGNVTSGNLLTSGVVSAAGNISANNISVSNLLNVLYNGNVGLIIDVINPSATMTATAGKSFIIGADNGNAYIGLGIDNTFGGPGSIQMSGNITGNYFIGNGSQLTGLGNASTLSSRSNVTVYSGSIANAAVANVTAVGFKGYALYGITTTANAWVTVYTSTAARTADSGRLITTDPTPGTGVVGEVITTSTSTQFFTPAAYGFSTETPPDTNVQLRISNQSGSTANIGVTLTLLKLEN